MNAQTLEVKEHPKLIWRLVIASTLYFFVIANTSAARSNLKASVNHSTVIHIGCGISKGLSLLRRSLRHLAMTNGRKIASDCE
jgi:hypothetical protein